MKTKSLLSAALLALIPSAGYAQNTPAPAAPTAGNATSLFTRVFIVPPDFLSRGKGGTTDQDAGADPFATPTPVPTPAPTSRPAKRILESLGVSFDAVGSSAEFNGANSRLIVKNTRDQLDSIEILLTGLFASGTLREGLVLFEAFSLPPLAARKALIAHPKESALYAWLDSELVKPDTAVRMERHSVTRVRGGQRSKTEGINEHAFPTEFDPPQVPQTISLSVSPASTAIPGTDKVFPPWPFTSTTPSDFRVRNLGWTVEVELTFSEDNKTADLNIAPENSRLVASIPYGLLGEIPQPVFETQKCTLQLTAQVGQPALASTFSPPVNTGVPNGNTDDRVWLLFVTVNRPQ